MSRTRDRNLCQRYRAISLRIAVICCYNALQLHTIALHYNYLKLGNPRVFSFLVRERGKGLRRGRRQTMDPGQMGQTPMTAEQLRALQNTLSPQQYAWLLKNLQQQQAQQQQAHAQQAMHQRQQGLLQQAQQAQQIQQAQAQQAQAQQAQQLLALQQRISQLPPEMQAQVQQQLRMQQHAQALQQRQQQQMQLQQGPGQHGQARSTPQQIMQMQQHQMQQRQLQIQRQQQLQMQQQRPQHLQLLQQQQQAQQQAQQLQHLNFHHPHSRPQGQPRALPPPSYPPPLRSGSGPVKRQRTYPKLPLPPLLPPMNTYAERLKKGDTGLLEPGLAQTSLSKRRGALARKSFREDSSSSEPESYSSSDEGEDQEEEEQDGQEENSDNENVSVQSRLQATKEREEDTSGLEKKEKRTLKLNLPPKERRAIRQTKHDYSRLYDVSSLCIYPGNILTNVCQ